MPLEVFGPSPIIRQQPNRNGDYSRTFSGVQVEALPEGLTDEVDVCLGPVIHPVDQLADGQAIPSYLALQTICTRSTQICQMRPRRREGGERLDRWTKKRLSGNFKRLRLSCNSHPAIYRCAFPAFYIMHITYFLGLPLVLGSLFGFTLTRFVLIALIFETFDFCPRPRQTPYSSSSLPPACSWTLCPLPYPATALAISCYHQIEHEILSLMVVLDQRNLKN